MKALFLTLAGVAAASALAIGVNSALAASHTPGTGARVAVANSTLGRVLVDGRGRTLYLFAKDKHGNERLHRAMRRLLAAADHVRQAARNGRSKGLPAQNHEAGRRTPAGHLQPSPALHVRQGHQEGPDQRRGSQRFRRRVVRSLSRRGQAREQRRQQQQHRQPDDRRLRLLGRRWARTRGPTTTAALSITHPCPPPTEKGLRP